MSEWLEVQSEGQAAGKVTLPEVGIKNLFLACRE